MRTVVCVCVREKEREEERATEREKEREIDCISEYDYRRCMPCRYWRFECVEAAISDFFLNPLIEQNWNWEQEVLQQINVFSLSYRHALSTLLPKDWMAWDWIYNMNVKIISTFDLLQVLFLVLFSFALALFNRTHAPYLHSHTLWPPSGSNSGNSDWQFHHNLWCWCVCIVYGCGDFILRAVDLQFCVEIFQNTILQLPINDKV